MILCFSGTGNSRHVADKLQELLGDELQRPAPGYMKSPDMFRLRISDHRMIWVFPVHAWGLPWATRNVLENMKFVAPDDCVHHAVITCGDDIGYADVQWRKAIEARGWKAGCAFTVAMPNVYTFMKGFDVDSKQLEAAKLAAVPARAREIAMAIEAEDAATDVVRGKMAWAKTYLLGPWFRAFKMSTKPFHANEHCNGCGKCARNCPLTNISMTGGRPRWGNACTMCSRCYHCCPQHAVQYGSATKGKGQYICPGFSLKN